MKRRSIFTSLVTIFSLCAATADAQSGNECTTPATPVIYPKAITVGVNEPVTYTISNVTVGASYQVVDEFDHSISDEVTAKDNAELTVSTSQFLKEGSRSLKILADMKNGCPVSSAPAVVMVATTSLPFDKIALKTRSANDGVLLQWEVLQEIDVDRYEIERSADGKQFKTVHVAQPSTTIQSKKNYSYSDKQITTPGKYYFRIRVVDVDGKYHYSPVASIDYESFVFDVFAKSVGRSSNPTLAVSLPEAGNVEFIYMDAGGRFISRQNMHFRSGNTDYIPNRANSSANLLFVVARYKGKQKTIRLSN